MKGNRQLQIGLLVLGIAGIIAYGAMQYFRKEFFPVEVGSEAPDFTAVTLDTIPRTKSLDDYRGHVLLINVWATWCAPCRVEMPSIEALHRSFAPKGLKVVAISIDDPGTEPIIRRFVEEYGLTFEILHDPQQKISQAYDITGYPETFVIGRDGVIRTKLMSATDWNSPEHRALVERLLAERVQ